MYARLNNGVIATNYNIPKLKGQADWGLWLRRVKELATDLDIWNLVDPLGDEELGDEPTVTEVDLPDYTPVPSQDPHESREDFMFKLHLWEANEAARERQFRMDRFINEQQNKALQKWQLEKDRLQQLWIILRPTLTTYQINRIHREKTLKGRMQALKSYIFPHPRSEIDQLIKDFWKLVHQTGTRNWEAWASRYYEVCERASAMQALELPEHLQMNRFFSAVRDEWPIWSSNMEMLIHERWEKAPFTMKRVIHRFEVMLSGRINQESSQTKKAQGT
jgi:hypothetical protein